LLFLFPPTNRAKRQKRSKENFLPSRQGKTKFWGLSDKPVACLPKLRSRFWGFVTTNPLLAFQNYFQHEQSEFLNCAAIFTTKKSKGSCTIHQLKKVMYKCALALFFARNINFEKVMCKCALFSKKGFKDFKENKYKKLFHLFKNKIIEN
jgi:hypothetical protein